MKESIKTVTAVVYVRKNTIQSNGDGTAIANQFQAIYEYASQNNIKIIKSYCDVPASGLRTGPGLKQLIKAIKTKKLKPKVVICTNYSKFSRRSDKLSKVLKALRSTNISIIAVESLNSDDFKENFRLIMESYKLK